VCAQPRIAVIGAGWFATIANLPSLADYDGADLVAICDRDAARAKETAARFGIPNCHTEVEELVAAGNVDGVVISVPHTAHYPVGRAVLDAGLHLLMEKPLALRATEAWDIAHRAESRGLHAMVGETYHFTSVAHRIRTELPRIGELLQITATFASHTERYFRGTPASADGRGASYADPALSGGGQGHTQLSHVAGLIAWTTGLRAAEVFAYMNNRDVAVDLVDSVAVRFVGGALGSLSATATMPPGHQAIQQIVYYGLDGVIVHDLLAAEGEVRPVGAPAERIALEPGEQAYPIGAPARAFADLIAGRSTENPAPVTPAAYSVELLEAAYRSADQGGPVRIDELI
jgi:predicted dehydrogenase